MIESLPLLPFRMLSERLRPKARVQSPRFMFFNRFPIFAFSFSAISIFSIQAAGCNQSALQNKSPPTENATDRKPFELPGLIVDFQNQCVDLEATVCLDKGLLELIACAPGSKEHESIVAIKSRALHIHTALLLLGLKNGNPAIRKRIGEDDPRWVDLPPRGDPVKLSFVIQDAKKKLIERPVGSFLSYADASILPLAKDKKIDSDRQKVGEPKKFPETFLFAGSQLADQGKGTRLYLAGKSGNIISIATFGDEVLCLPEVNSHKNNSLKWRIKPNQLPRVGTRIVLRIRPAQKKKSVDSTKDKSSPANNDPKGSHESNPKSESKKPVKQASVKNAPIPKTK